MQVSITTWTRDSHELFDYESRNVIRQQLSLEDSRRIYRRTAEVIVASDREDSYPEGGEDGSLEYLLRAVYLDGRFIVQPAERQPETIPIQAKKLWLVVKDLGQYVLSEGDVIKLGRFKLRVRQTCHGPVDEPVRPDISSGENTCGSFAPPESDGMPCRICLLEGTGRDEDPLIEVCKCKGSIQFIHLGCLRYWINGRLCLSDASKHAYLFKQLACELCKTNYPVDVQLNGNVKVPLVPMPETRAPYIVLENMMRSEHPPDQVGGPQAAPPPRGVFVISLAGKKILKLGRGHESDVRIADVSISRWHATVSFSEDGRFVLEDHASKFGTLVAMRRPKVVDPANADPLKQSLCVQAGRTLFRFNAPDHLPAEAAATEASLDPAAEFMPWPPGPVGNEGGPPHHQ